MGAGGNENVWPAKKRGAGLALKFYDLAEFFESPAPVD